MKYFVSDPHFGHNAIIDFERFQFETIKDHDKHLIECFTKWSKKLKSEDELWILGDWGDTSYLYLLDMFRCKTCFVYGNHDSQSDKEKFEMYFDEVYEYPVYLSNKLVVSHIPVAVFEDQINVHGHLHGAILNSPNYICCSMNVVDYKLISEQRVSGAFAQLPKYNRRFLWEPFAHMMKFSFPREDVVMNKDNLIDLAASRALQLFVKRNKS